ncbi:MAG: serine/threonine protein kinase, partial [Planctomycetaceae bacterium]
LVDGLIHATNEAGKTFIYAASRDGLKIEAENQLGDSVFATPAICGGRIYQRIARTENGTRQEYLVCIR